MTRSDRFRSWRRALASLLLAIAITIAPSPITASTINYVYDELGRLVGVIDPGGETAAYRYDDVGNMLSIARYASTALSIIGFSPGRGPIGADVTIWGTGFSPAPSQNAVRFNGTAAAVVSAGPTELVTTVPAGATTGPISVTTGTASASTASVFTVTASGGPPAISGFSPVVGVAGTAVTITGTNFETLAADNRVVFNDLRRSPVLTASPTSLVTTVPASVGSGRIAIATPAGKAVSAADFFIPPAPHAAADVQATARLGKSGSQTLGIDSPGKIGLVVFDGMAGERLTLGLSAVTIASSTVAVHNPDASRLTSAPVGAGGRSVNLELPTDGTYTILLDPDGTSTGSMTFSLATPDLAPAGVTAPASVNAQQSVAVSWTVRNQGQGSASGLWTDTLYISREPVCCAGATSLGAFNVAPTVPAGGSYTQTQTVNIPSLAPGAYYLLLWTDSSNLVYESDEANNRLAQPITVTAPDLVPTALTAPPSVSTQQSVSVSWTVRNEGSGPATGSWTDTLYLSASSTCCAGATALLNLNVAPATAPGGSYTQTQTVKIPSLTAGSYYFIVSTDANQNRSEVEEGNNQLAQAVTVTTPDLFPTSLTAPLLVSPRQSVSTSWTVKNQGTGPAVGLWTDTLYISPTPTCCAGATSLRSVNVSPGTPPGSTYSQTQTVTIPGLATGTYYLIVKTDANNVLYESSETNNERARKIYVRKQ
ncbi:MAG TPA: CARDB domain-containing protein [Methylomirabilota bacterium]|jgi:YD repeat-containing protein|nr:CARDB domain-containing protein [Methylomirabilota bacterium]